jgi:hypothetical protein
LATVFLTLEKISLDLLSGITQLFNFDLRVGLYVSAWNVKQPFAKPHVLDVNQFLEKIIKNSCLAEHATPYCKGYLFFNDKHPTTTAGKVLAVYLYNNLKK